MADENGTTEEVEDQRAPYEHPGGRDFRVRDEHDSEPQDVRDYIGVTEEYKTYANAYDAPILTDTERFVHTNQYDHLEGNLDGEAGEESEQEEEKSDKKSDEKPTQTAPEASEVRSAKGGPSLLPPLG
jgi:hypothetical protein